MNTLKRFSNIQAMEDRLLEGHYPFRYGLPNMANTCYMNACIASLSSDRTIVGLFGSDAMTTATQSNQLANNFSRLVSALFWNNADNIAIYKTEFENCFIENSDLFMRGQQEDAQEFFIYLFQWLQEHFQRSRIQNQITTDALNCLNNYYINTRRQTTCANGHVTNNDTRDGFITLIVDETRQLNFDQLLARNFRPMNFDSCVCNNGHSRNCNAFHCTPCNRHVAATSRQYLTNLPDRIVIAVNLFEIVEGFVSFILFILQLIDINYYFYIVKKEERRYKTKSSS